MERSHDQHLERETASVERSKDEPFDALRQQSDAASQLQLQQKAIEKGQTRIPEAEQFSQQSAQEIESYNQTCVNQYEARYRHEIDLTRNDTECYLYIDTHV